MHTTLIGFQKRFVFEPLKSPLPKIANCGEVCVSQLVPLRHKPREDDDDDDGFEHTLHGYTTTLNKSKRD